jgi:hypothetical protein
MSFSSQEDMNLNEDKKVPLRHKDLTMKREMVIQYVFTASKTVSLTPRHVYTPHASSPIPFIRLLD